MPDSVRSPSPQEQKFSAENGMTVEESWAKVTEWHLAGRKEEAHRGCEIILQYFPEHPAKDLLHTLEGETIHKKNLGEKFGSVFADSMEGMLKKKKPVPSSSNPSPEVPKKESELDPLIPTTPVLDDERLFGTIAYAWIFCIIPLLMKKDSVFVQFHAKQGVVMAILLTVFDFTVGSLLNLISAGIGLFLKLVYIAFLAYAAYQAYQGKYWKIPGVYQISKKINF